MTTIPGGWKDLAAPASRASAGAAQQHTEQAAPISGQRCLPVCGPQLLASARRCAAPTRLGMPAWTPAPPEPASSRDASDLARATSPTPLPPRRKPPPLPAHLVRPKVLVAAPLLPDTMPARRLQLQDVTCELETMDLLPLRGPALPVPLASIRAAGIAAAPGGLRGLLTVLLIRLLSLVAPSLQLPLQRRSRDGRARRR